MEPLLDLLPWTFGAVVWYGVMVWRAFRRAWEEINNERGE